LIQNGWVNSILTGSLTKFIFLGTHDSGTYALNLAFTECFYRNSKSLDITEQLEHGIRYLDRETVIWW